MLSLAGTKDVNVGAQNDQNNKVSVSLPPNVQVSVSNVGGTICLDAGIVCTGPGGVTAETCNDSSDECVCPAQCSGANYGALMRGSCQQVSDGQSFSSGGTGEAQFFINGDCDTSNNSGSFDLTLTYPDYTVSATVASGQGSIEPASQSVDHGGTASGTLSADVGWSLDTLTGNTCSPVDNGDGTWSATNITAACAVTATFVINTYTVTGVVGSGSGSITPISQSVDHGDAATLTVTPDTGWHIDTVSGCGGSLSDNSYTTDSVTGDCTVTANFLINTYTVTFVDHDTSVLKTETVDHGSAATAPADPTRPGYTFTGWDMPFDNVTGDLTVTAQYEVAEVEIFFDRFESDI